MTKEEQDRNIISKLCDIREEIIKIMEHDTKEIGVNIYHRLCATYMDVNEVIRETRIKLKCPKD